MSNSALDTDARDRELDPVHEELERDHASLSYVSTWLDTIIGAKTLNEAHDRAAQLKGRIDGQLNALRAEMMRLRTPDS